MDFVFSGKPFGLYGMTALISIVHIGMSFEELSVNASNRTAEGDVKCGVRACETLFAQKLGL